MAAGHGARRQGHGGAGGLSSGQGRAYGEAELLAARPGDTVTGTAQWQSAAHFDSDDVTHFNARGVYALLYGREDVRLSAGDGDALRWLPQRAGKAFREKVAAIWDDPRVSGFLTAELTGDKSAMDDGDYLAMRRRAWRICSRCPACTALFW